MLHRCDGDEVFVRTTAINIEWIRYLHSEGMAAEDIADVLCCELTFVQRVVRLLDNPEKVVEK